MEGEGGRWYEREGDGSRGTEWRERKRDGGRWREREGDESRSGRGIESGRNMKETVKEGESEKEVEFEGESKASECEGEREERG